MQNTANNLNDLSKLSYVRGAQDKPLMFTTIAAVFAKNASQYAERDAAIFCQQNIRYTYSQLAKKVDALAAGFLRLGLTKGDRVGIWSPNRAEWLISQFATARLGIILVNINPAYRIYELEHALNLVNCKALITAELFKSSDYISMLQTLVPELETHQDKCINSQKLPHLKHVIKMGNTQITGMYNFDDICDHTQIDKAVLDELSSQLDPDDPINIQFTSGTTGAPKGACLSHYNILNNAYFVTDRINFTHQDRLCLPVPLYHCFGMVMGVLGCITHGAALVFPSEAFDAGATLTAIEAENCTALYGVPTMFIAIFEHENFTKTDKGNMRRGVMAGALCPIEVMRRAIDEMNMDQLTICYGMTETSPVSFQTLVDTPLKQRCESVGKIHPHVEVKIINKQNQIVPIGEKGELCTRGYSVMRGYWADEARTNETIDPSGWLKTGDLAILDEQGYCQIVGRIKDMIIRGGENIYPREIEDFLFKHPDILQVQIFGIHSQRFGEAVAAFIILKQDARLNAQQVKTYCKDQIAHFKIPEHIEFVQQWPATITGKPQKYLMREMMENIINQQNNS